ncbi:MAG: UDP-glucose 4-epimerase [Candidatus Omnitrophica bacterium ADurb.Bin292]|nr:MAG: UDP-glucose 4-epimerase [Candidatus Omnitrophica bacterium ADurb.Bin292]
MKALVTGGAGFIGSNLVRLLVEKKHSVTVLDNLSTGHLSNLGPFPSVKFIKGDIRDERTISRALRGVDIVFHLAASVGNSLSIKAPVYDSETNVLGTLKLLRAAHQNHIKKIVYSSSAGILGELKELPINENHPTNPISPYGVSKLAAEKMCLVYNSLYGMKNVCLRYFNVYGINQRYDAYGNVIPIFARRIIRKQPLFIFGDGYQTRDFVNVIDVAKANYQAAITGKVAGAFNIASGASITINKLANMMMQTARTTVPLQHKKPRLGDVRDSLANISAARKAFGFKPSVSLEEGLKKYMSWASQNRF